ncbi:hypothetical protein CEXT_323281 [Caerostris extrusa]|uniref:Uncharacterized protein n=1 Tax=Caerostris extrusa TaxID=172846 RepID=A0AAV4QU77_CAEEX|nr:hypothetical protein CEXT_323281 [Caerostris extrusa]
MSLLTEKISEANIKESEPPSPIYIDLFMRMLCTRIGMRSSALLKPRIGSHDYRIPRVTETVFFSLNQLLTEQNTGVF